MYIFMCIELGEVYTQYTIIYSELGLVQEVQDVHEAHSVQEVQSVQELQDAQEVKIVGM